MYDRRVSVNVEIDRPPETVFDFLVSPAKIPLVLPGLIENTEIPELPLRPGSRFHYKYQMYGVMLEGSWICKTVEQPSRYEAETDGDVPSLWTYGLTGDGKSTRVSLVCTYQTPASVLAKIKADVMLRINQKEAEAYFQNLKTVLELAEA
ncbi:MAG: SRPBCC family protein [Thermoanaerobaculia bacterium]